MAATGEDMAHDGGATEPLATGDEPLLETAADQQPARGAGRFHTALAVLAAVAVVGAAVGVGTTLPALLRPSGGQTAVSFRGTEPIETFVVCSATTKDECVKKRGCHWFSVSKPCKRCQEWIGDEHDVTGCRDWNPFKFCQDIIFMKVAENSKSAGITPRDPEFVEVVRSHHFFQGTFEVGSPHKKQRTCDVWCDAKGSTCFGQPKQDDSLRGVNYGGRFIPEEFLGLLGTGEYLFKGVKKPKGMLAKSICDIEAADSGKRMARFLSDNIKKEHFERMADFGFNVVRLPLGYWNLIDLPAGQTPDGPASMKARWKRMQGMMKASYYKKWIDMVFDFAKKTGIKVLMDLHSAPGGQSGNECTGCNAGPSDAIFYLFGPDGKAGRNVQLTVDAIEAMAKICAEKGDTCYGIELLNEPYGAHTDLMYATDLVKDLKICEKRKTASLPCNGIDLLFSADQLRDTTGLIRAFNESKKNNATSPPQAMPLYRQALKGLYGRAIKAARAHMDKEKPIVIMDWPVWLAWWKDNAQYTFQEHGRIVFATHMYHFPDPPTTKQQPARDMFKRDIARIRDFFLESGFELVITEYALNSHGSGQDDDHFDYNAFAHWSVHQFDQFGIGSMIWNYDSYWAAWGSIAQPNVGHAAMDWKMINA